MVHIMVARHHCSELRVNSLHSTTEELCAGHIEHPSVARSTLHVVYAVLKEGEQNSKEFYTGIMI